RRIPRLGLDSAHFELGRTHRLRSPRIPSGKRETSRSLGRLFCRWTGFNSGCSATRQTNVRSPSAGHWPSLRSYVLRRRLELRQSPRVWRPRHLADSPPFLALPVTGGSARSSESSRESRLA